MAGDKLILLKVHDDGQIELVPVGTKLNENEVESVDQHIQTPRWQHWHQRKLARVWSATLLGMNIEPNAKARAALKKFHPERFQIYRDRLDIARTLVGHDLGYFADHLREGGQAGEKYVDLGEYYDFAMDKGWGGMEDMRKGLCIDGKRSTITTREQNGHLKLLSSIFASFVPGFGLHSKSNEEELRALAKLVRKWLDEGNAECPDERTLYNWLTRMVELSKGGANF